MFQQIDDQTNLDFSSSWGTTGDFSFSESIGSSYDGLGAFSMFDEIRDGIGFLLGFLYDKVPRRKVFVLGEQFANFLALKYHNHWDPNEPLKDAEYRSIKINQANGTNDANLIAAASAVGLDVRELVQLLPANFELYINPGEVMFRQASGILRSVPGRRLSFGRRGSVGSRYSSKWNSAKSGGFNLDADSQHTPPISPLNLGLTDRAACTNWIVADSNNANNPVFEISGPHDVKFTVGMFSKTRFGSTKIKSDPVEKRAMLIGKAKAIVGQWANAAADQRPGRAEQVAAKLLLLQPPLAFRQPEHPTVDNLPGPPEMFAFEEASMTASDRRGRPIVAVQYAR
uniref:Anti-proliferative protein domain-containing protein n=1 Tax=Plectus sambesii TaxID=2011161 RepID=A0A914WCT4_9BILA